MECDPFASDVQRISSRDTTSDPPNLGISKAFLSSWRPVCWFPNNLNAQIVEILDI